MAGLNQTPQGERVHIGIFGKRNAGKSSLINALANQEIAVVSQVKGTTTDPVIKAMELLPLGPVVLIDTPGLDDKGELGEKRVKKSYQVLNKTDIAIVVIDVMVGKTEIEERLIKRLKEKNIPYLICFNKCDTDLESGSRTEKGEGVVFVSAKNGDGINALKEILAHMLPEQEEKRQLVADLLKPSDFVVLVVPIDGSAPKGRLILPRQQTIRDILESNAVSIVVREHELVTTLSNLTKKPRLVITDSQAFEQVARDTPEDILLTSFSILFARYKGNLKEVVKGARALDTIKDGDKILISEGCTHHRQCEDIGTVKLPRWIREKTKKEVEFVFSSGTEFPEELGEYKLIVHCGGCMLNEREMKYRIQCANDQNIPITNYGILIAYMKGILKRSLMPFPEILDCLLDERK